MLSIFSCAYWPFIYLFKFVAHFSIMVVFLLLNCKSFLIHSRYKPLIRYMTCKYFFPFSGCLLKMWIVSFDAQKFLILVYCNLSIFAFVACAFGVISKKSLPNSMSWSFSPKFSSIVLALMFKPLFHFEIIFIYDVS